MNADYSDGSLARALGDNWKGSYAGVVATLGGEVRDFGAIQAFRTPGVPATFANGAVVSDPAEPDDLVAAVEWVRDNGMPFSVQLRGDLEPELGAAVTNSGLVRHDWLMPGMALAPIPVAPAPPAGVTTTRTDEHSHGDFIDALVDQGLSRPFVEAAFGAPAFADTRIAAFVARLDGSIAGESVLYRTGDVAGVYAVGTSEHARRRGVGTAVTWAAVEQAREWGCWAVTLQATDMGLPVYLKMGFRTVVEYVTFASRGAFDNA